MRIRLILAALLSAALLPAALTGTASSAQSHGGSDKPGGSDKHSGSPNAGGGSKPGGPTKPSGPTNPSGPTGAGGPTKAGGSGPHAESTPEDSDSGGTTDAGGKVDSTLPPASSPPVLRQTGNVAVVWGSVRVKISSGASPQPLSAASKVPLGSVIDAVHGQVTLEVALHGGRTQSVTLWGGTFKFRQPRGRHGMTDLTLRGGSFRDCRQATGSTRRGTVAAAARARRRHAHVVRSLWATDNHGRFRTYGKNSVATVRGTTWETVERCDGTVFHVLKGRVSVLSTRSGRRVTVGAGHSLLVPRRP